MDSSDMTYTYSNFMNDLDMNFAFDPMDLEMYTNATAATQAQHATANTPAHGAEATTPDLEQHPVFPAHQHRHYSVSPPSHSSIPSGDSTTDKDEQSNDGALVDIISDMEGSQADLGTMQQQQLRFYREQQLYQGRRRAGLPTRVSSAADFCVTPPYTMFMAPPNIPENGAFEGYNEELMTPLISPATTPIYNLFPRNTNTAPTPMPTEHFSPLSSPVLRPQSATADIPQLQKQPQARSGKRGGRGANPSVMKARQSGTRANPIGTAPPNRRRASAGPIVMATPALSSVSTPSLNVSAYQSQQQGVINAMRQQSVKNNNTIIAMSKSAPTTGSLTATVNKIHQLSPGSIVLSQPSPPALGATITVPPSYISISHSPVDATYIPASIAIPASISIPTSVPSPATVLPPPTLFPLPLPIATSTTTTTTAHATTSIVAPVTPASLMKLSSSRSSKTTKPPVPVLPIFTGHPIAPGSVPTNAIPSISIPSPSLKPTQVSPIQVPMSPRIAPSGAKQLISPNLKPGGGHVLSSMEAAERLASKSNYRILADGETAAVGIIYTTDIHSGIELRRTSHKAAEQKRRDSLKQCFDDLRGVVPDATERNPSKVYLLKKSYDYILQLKRQSHYKDNRISALKSQVLELRARLGLPLEMDEDDEEEKSNTAFRLGSEARLREAEDEEGDSDDEASAEGNEDAGRGSEGARKAGTDAGMGDA